MFNGQLSIDHSNTGKLIVTLPNYPAPDETTEGLTPEPLYRNPETGKLKARPPVHEDKQEEGQVLIRRDDNDEVCGFRIKSFGYGDSVNLLNYEQMEGPYISYNPPSI